MYNFCMKCGSKLDPNTGLCPNCDQYKTINFNSNENIENTEYIQNDGYIQNNEYVQNNGYVQDNEYMQNSDYVQNNVVTYKKKRRTSLIIITIIICFLLLLGSFITLDYFEVINTKVCASLGLKPYGTFTLEADKTIVYVNDSDKNNVTFYCQPNVDYDSVELHCENDNSKVGDFSDDGDFLKNGDVSSKDGIFSSTATITKEDETNISYYAIIKKGLKYYKSNTISIDVKDTLSDSDISKIEESQNKISETISDNFYNKTLDEKKKSILNLLNGMSGDNGVIDSKSISFDDVSNVYTYRYKNGTYGCVEIPDEDGAISYSSSTSSKNTPDYTYNNDSVNNELSSEGKDTKNKNSTNKVTIMYDVSKNSYDILNLYKELQLRWKEKGVDVDFVSNPTIDEYGSKLSSNSLVLMATKGSKITFPKSKIGNTNTYSAICTNVEVNKSSLKKYKNDLCNNNIICASTENGTCYWLLPSFFANHYGKDGLKNSIMLFENAYGMAYKGQVDFSLLLKTSGVTSALGYHNDVNLLSKYDSAYGDYIVNVNKTRNFYMKRYGSIFTETVADELINSSSIEDAVNFSKKIFGNTQYDYFYNNNLDYISKDNDIYPTVVGKKDAKISFSDVSNIPEKGDFILKKDNFIFISDKESITLKSSALDKGRKIYTGKNNGHMMCDGKHLLFVDEVTNVSDSTYYCYSIDLDGKNLNLEFTNKSSIVFVTCNDSYLYYLKRGLDSNKLMKRSLSYGENNDGEIEIGNAAKACVVGNNIVFSQMTISVTDIENSSVSVYHMDTGKTEKICEKSIVDPTLYTKNYCYLKSYKYNNSKNTFTACKIQIVDKTGKLVKTINMKNGYLPVYVSRDDTFIVLFDQNENVASGFHTYNYYKYDLNSGEITELKTTGDKSLIFINDLYNDDIYCKVLVPFSETSDVDANIYKLDDSEFLVCKGNNNVTIRINSYCSCIMDGLYVDIMSFGSYPYETYQESVMGLSIY